MKKPCDIARGERTRGGYIRVKRSVNGKPRNVRAHREAWEKANGPIPPGMFILHRCDNRACREPEHLFLGTHKDNMEDMMSKGRSCRGRRNHKARLHPENIRHIRRSRLTSEDLSEIYGVTLRMINLIRSKARWAHID